MNSIDTNQENSETQNPVNVELKKFSLPNLPDYVMDLMQNVDGFAAAFYRKNPRYQSSLAVDYLPDFFTDAKGDNILKWRFVGWERGKKYTAERLRHMRQTASVTV